MKLCAFFPSVLTGVCLNRPCMYVHVVVHIIGGRRPRIGLGKPIQEYTHMQMMYFFKVILVIIMR